MNMKMKVLDCTLIGILAGLAAPSASAQEQAAQPAPAVDCTDDGCRAPEGDLLMRVRTRGERKPITDAGASTTQELQPDRRVTVQTEQPGKAVALGRWMVQLPGGGVIWATEDPNLGQPQFDVSATSLVPFDGHVTEPVKFYAYNNYASFIDHADVLIYRASDTDLVAPLATVPLPGGLVSEATWDGTLPGGFQARAGDELTYIVRAYGADGSYDETYPRTFQLVSPDEAKRGGETLRNATERQLGKSMDAAEAEAQSQIQTVFGNDALRVQNIPIYGSRIRIQGRNLPDNASITINSRPQPLDLEHKLVAEYLEPVGRHTFDIEVRQRGSEPLKRSIDVDVSGRYMFAVALADLTVSGNRASGSM